MLPISSCWLSSLPLPSLHCTCFLVPPLPLLWQEAPFFFPKPELRKCLFSQVDLHLQLLPLRTAKIYFFSLYPHTENRKRKSEKIWIKKINMTYQLVLRPTMKFVTPVPCVFLKRVAQLFISGYHLLAILPLFPLFYGLGFNHNA